MLKIVEVDLGVDIVQHISKFSKALNKRTVFISANKRSIRFIESLLTPEEILNIDFFTLDEFAKDLVFSFKLPPLTMHTPIERSVFFLKLLKSYSENHNDFLGNLDLSDLFPWAKRLSSLFDEIDRQLLSERLENYQYIEGSEVSKFILGGLKELYAEYERKYKDFTFAGKNLKLASEIVKTDRFQKDASQKMFVFFGFVYLSNAEIEILKNISSVSDCYFFMHTDLMGREGGFNTFGILKDTKDKIEEAGVSVDFEKVMGEKNETEFKVFEFTRTMDEVRFAAKLMESIVGDFENKDNPRNLAVILPKNTNVVPLLSFLDKDRQFPINITMSYPLSASDICVFIETFFDVLLDVRSNIDKGLGNCASSNLVLRLLNSSFFNYFNDDISGEAERLKRHILDFEPYLVCFDQWRFIHEILRPFLKINSFRDVYTAFRHLLSEIDRDKLVKNDLLAQSVNSFFKEIAETFDRMDYDLHVDLKLVREIFMQILPEIYLPFEGHPLKGVQIMGMLESRMLSFDTVMFLDVNEGILPSQDRIDSLMPQDIKRALGLSSYKEKEQLVRYNFFRLAYSSKRCLILYRNATSKDEKNLRSRFLEQIILNHELQDKILDLKVVDSFVLSKDEPENGVIKDGFLNARIEELLDMGLSPTALDTYITCPYSFYLKYVKGIPPAPSFDEELESGPIGSLVHFILKRAFENYVGEILGSEKLRDVEDRAIKLAGRILDKGYSFGDDTIDPFLKKISDFKREALNEVITYRLKEFFKKHSWVDFRLEDLEKDLKCERLRILGRLDRVDIVDDSVVRVIDYKTGKVNLPKKVNLSKLFKPLSYSIDEIAELKENVKSLQLPVYLILVKENYGYDKFQAYLVLLGESGGDIFKGFSCNADDVVEFESLVSYVIDHIVKSEKFYAISGTHCQYCEYADFCVFSKI